MDGEKIFTTKRNVILFAIICTFLWGSAYPGVKTGLELFQIPTEDIFGKMAFAGYRFTLSGILVLLLNFILF
ncbi:MAG TPA: EamA family transporter, partial [Eubacteriaceae bacterium]|nr:EamA family transporter [Eubacteriaceae bacterium]